MSVTTNNAYGKISISDAAIAKVAARSAMESYGIVEVYSHRVARRLVGYRLMKKGADKAIKVVASGNRIVIDVSVVVKYGVSISAVADSLKEAVKYDVERFTGMIVTSVNVTVVGVKR
jgi:uncharacterized alkaline shock family protein YloU